MLLRILRRSLFTRLRSSLLFLVGLAVPLSVASTFLAVRHEIGTHLAASLRGYGANILVEPRAGMNSIRVRDLVSIKRSFWRNNITGIAPFLQMPVTIRSGTSETQATLVGTWFRKLIRDPEVPPFVAGVSLIAPWWNLEGDWPAASDEAIVGRRLAAKLGAGVGSRIAVESTGRIFRLSGVVTTGGIEEERIFAPLVTVQTLAAQPGECTYALVSALSVPLDSFGRRDPNSLSKSERERWLCTAYVSSVAASIEEAVGGATARPIWRVAEAETRVLLRIRAFAAILTVLALGASALAVTSGLLSTFARRRREIALFKAIGADWRGVAALLLSEVLTLATAGGLLGTILAALAVKSIAVSVLNAPLPFPGWILPVNLATATAIAAATAIPAIRRVFAVPTVWELS